jgi:hypothetical protein
MIAPISRKIMMSFEFSINKETMEINSDCCDDCRKQKYQPALASCVSCVTDDFVICVQAEWVKVFSSPSPPPESFWRGFFIWRL